MKNVTEQIYKSIGKSEISLLVLPDRSKAVDYTVNHDLQLNKLVQLTASGLKVIGVKANIQQKKIKSCPSQSPIYMEYRRDKYLVQSSSTLLSMTFLKLIYYQK